MADLNRVLQQTMLLTANPSLKSMDEPNFTVSRVEALPPEQLSKLSDADILRKRIWHYDWDPSRPTEIRNLTARVRAMNDMEMTVCERIAWGPVSIRLRMGERIDELPLPLTKDHLVRSYFLDEGSIPESSAGLWQLPANLHSSYQLVFAYQMSRDRSKGWEKPSAKQCAEWTFLSDADPASLPCEGYSGPGYTAVELQMDPLRVVVVVTLALCTERNDFDPGGVLGGARIYPTIMTIANMPLEEINARVTVERPAHTSMQRMDGEEMLPDLSPALFTDRNFPGPRSGATGWIDLHVAPPLFWDEIFDYYDTEPRADDQFMAVTHGTTRRGWNGRTEFVGENYQPPKHELSGLVETWSESGYQERLLWKVAGQGAFDNIHIAPKMKAPDDVLYSYDSDALRKSLRRITMAPFCIHDCLHTHWRWGEFNTEKHTLGWDGFTPYRKPGAPLVPPNQEVRIQLRGAGYEYVVKVVKPESSQWQVIMHHGAAYAVSTSQSLLDRTLIHAGKTIADRSAYGFPGNAFGWYAFYWRLRYGHPQTMFEDFSERIRIGGARGMTDVAHRREALRRLREY